MLNWIEGQPTGTGIAHARCWELERRSTMKKITKIIITICALTAVVAAVGSCASINRKMKTIGSELNNGIEREIVVYDAVGNEVYRQSGKFDVDYSNDRVLYDDENGKRHTIYFKNGIVVVNEL